MRHISLAEILDEIELMNRHEAEDRKGFLLSFGIYLGITIGIVLLLG